MKAAAPSPDNLDATLAIGARFGLRMFRTLAGLTLGAHLVYLLLGRAQTGALAWLVFGTAVGLVALVEASPDRLWRRVATPRHDVGMVALGTLYALYVAVAVAVVGGDARAPAIWWLTVFPCCVILAGSLRIGVALLAGALGWLVLVRVAARSS
jgi:hypothetical protein